MPESSRNYVALFVLILGKALGIGGLIVGAVHRVAGGTLLALDGVFILAAIVLCLRVARGQAQAAQDDKRVLARLIREGTLKQYLRDLEKDLPRSQPVIDDGAAAE
jgi:hypothetical protein